jgi:hypothetical protein
MCYRFFYGVTGKATKVLELLSDFKQVDKETSMKS